MSVAQHPHVFVVANFSTGQSSTGDATELGGHAAGALKNTDDIGILWGYDMGDVCFVRYAGI